MLLCIAEEECGTSRQHPGQLNPLFLALADHLAVDTSSEVSIDHPLPMSLDIIILSA